MKNVLLLGASGSIGTQSLDIIFANPGRFSLKGISIGHQVNKLGPILDKFKSIEYVCLQEEKDYLEAKRAYPCIRFYHGDKGLLELINATPCDMVINALVGFAGLLPSIETLKLNKILCLANKESLVVGGKFVFDLLNKGHGKLYPIDSEHVAIAKLLSCVSPSEVKNIWITGSGGPFRNKKREELKEVTPKEALAHPTWHMGAKISIDSATMMNKGFEIIEAKWLYDYPLDRIKVVLHDESKVHSLIELNDGSFLADVSNPDMHGPIEYALFEGKIQFKPTHVAKMEDIEGCHFHKFDPNRFIAVPICLDAYSKGGSATTVLNASNEEAIYAFLDNNISFLDIEDIVSSCLSSIPFNPNPSIEEVVQIDKETRKFVKELVRSKKK